MPKQRKTLSRLAVAVAVLVFLNLFTLVLTADAILQVYDNTPTVSVELPVAQTGGLQDAMNPGFSHQETRFHHGQEPTVPTGSDPHVETGDRRQLWREWTWIDIFDRGYDETGRLTVVSSDWENVIAPGTGSRYYFDVRNTGSTGARYWLEARSAVARVEYNDEIVEIPIQVKFSRYRGGAGYLLGGRDRWAPLSRLNGVKDFGTLSSGHYTRYVLDWQWAYEGDDTLDTLLGDLAAAGEELRVWVYFNVYAEADDVASGGYPQTGDSNNLALWAGLFACSAMALLLLIIPRKKEEDKNV